MSGHCAEQFSKVYNRLENSASRKYKTYQKYLLTLLYYSVDLHQTTIYNVEGGNMKKKD